MSHCSQKYFAGRSVVIWITTFLRATCASNYAKLKLTVEIWSVKYILIASLLVLPMGALHSLCGALWVQKVPAPAPAELHFWDVVLFCVRCKWELNALFTLDESELATLFISELQLRKRSAFMRVQLGACVTDWFSKSPRGGVELAKCQIINTVVHIRTNETVTQSKTQQQHLCSDNRLIERRGE